MWQAYCTGKRQSKYGTITSIWANDCVCLSVLFLSIFCLFKSTKLKSLKILEKEKQSQTICQHSLSKLRRVGQQEAIGTKYTLQTFFIIIIIIFKVNEGAKSNLML